MSACKIGMAGDDLFSCIFINCFLTNSHPVIYYYPNDLVYFYILNI